MLRDIARYTVSYKTEKKKGQGKRKTIPVVPVADLEYLTRKILIFRKHVRGINYNHPAASENGNR